MLKSCIYDARIQKQKETDKSGKLIDLKWHTPYAQTFQDTIKLAKHENGQFVFAGPLELRILMNFILYFPKESTLNDL